MHLKSKVHECTSNQKVLVTIPKIESAICIRESELGILFILKLQNKVEFNDLNLVVSKVKW